MKRFFLKSAVATVLLACGFFLNAADAEDPGQRIETIVKNEKGDELRYPSCTLTPADGSPVYPIRVEVDGKVVIKKNTSGLLRCRYKKKNHEAMLSGHMESHVTMRTLPSTANDGENDSPKKCRAECFKLIDVPLDAAKFPDRFYAEDTPAFYQCMYKCLF